MIKWLFYTIVVALSIFLSCTSNADSFKSEYHLTITIPASGSVIIEQISSIKELNEDVAKLVKQVGLYQIMLQKDGKSALFGLPDLYLSHPGSYSFSLTTTFKADSIHLYRMDGSSGHFTLKNQPSLQSIKIAN